MSRIADARKGLLLTPSAADIRGCLAPGAPLADRRGRPCREQRRRPQGRKPVGPVRVSARLTGSRKPLAKESSSMRPNRALSVFAALAVAVFAATSAFACGNDSANKVSGTFDKAGHFVLTGAWNQDGTPIANTTGLVLASYTVNKNIIMPASTLTGKQVCLFGNLDVANKTMNVDSYVECGAGACPAAGAGCSAAKGASAAAAGAGHCPAMAGNAAASAGGGSCTAGAAKTASAGEGCCAAKGASAAAAVSTAKTPVAAAPAGAGSSCCMAKGAAASAAGATCHGDATSTKAAKSDGKTAV